MADLPAAASFTKPRGPLRLGDYSWTPNARQEAATRYLFRDPIIGNIPAPRRLRDYGWSCNLVTTTLRAADQSPFIGIAFQSTPAPRRAREYGWSVVNLLQSTLAPAQVDPFHPAEFPAPRRAPRARDYDWSANLLQTTLKPTPQTVVFRVAVVAKPKPRKQLDYGWNCNNILLLGEPLLPVEWDAPERAKRLHDYSWNPEVSALLLPPTPVVVPEPTVQVERSGGGHRRKDRRKRYLLPDGKLVFCTYEEVVEIIQASSKPVVEEPQEERSPKKPIRVVALGPVAPSSITIKPTTKKGVRGKPQKVSLPKTYEWAPDPSWYALALKALRDREEEEEIVMMLVLH